ncbi:hypothetical protein Rsub_03240 [Raphidocelis subcapitata]|uniref:Uncharacterized protein n=1 Tax=Raphidocelis subcapitata TaxID=307507 RepID=A0A2V0NSL9_9CHLO|nr:hypothetical protein Rsub_03240 [Raphidocelis subcapitata]|eukprot:GBF90668.1 hypothetical protein Rsub_03240 [Raphidocelis subcapitata]
MRALSCPQRVWGAPAAARPGGRRLAAPRSSQRNAPGGLEYEQLLAVQRHLLQVDAARAKAVEDVELYSGQLIEERKERARLEQQVAALRSELAAANARAEQLEAEALQARQLVAAYQRQLGQQPAAAVATPAPAPQSPAEQQQQQGQQQATAPPPTSEAAAAAAPSGTITLQYFSGWGDVFIHYCADGKGWTKSPGVKLASSPDGSCRSVTVPAQRLEFVMNNGQGEWDSPGRYSDAPGNYQADAPGTYKLKSGRLERLP